MTTKLHFISAGAGSGKTYRLTQILHAKLIGNEIRPAGVIATTFTRKAATELRERVRSHLLEQGAYKIANAMGQARIGTVNGVCGELLARFAFEAGMSPEQQVLEEAQEKALMAKAIESVMEAEDVAALVAMARRMGIEDWKANLREIIGQVRSNDIPIDSVREFAARNADDLLQYFPKATGDDLAGLLLKEIENALSELEQGALEGQKQNTRTYLTLIKDMRRKLQYGDFAWSDWVKLAAAAPEKRLTPITEGIGEIADRYAEHPDLQQDLRNYLERLFALCGKALHAYADRKREMGVLDFTDQEHLLLKVLDHEVVAATLDEELDLLMVDEFQDTSPIQLALFLKLARHAKEVYWVGDIKQAIYGFRGSDTTLMKAILDELARLGGDKEVLDNSWRSRKPLVGLVNEVFVPAFAGALGPDEVRLSAQRTEALDGPAFANWELHASKIEGRNSAMAAGIKKLLASDYQVFDKSSKQIRQLRRGDIAILARSNDGVAAIADALREQDVPAAISQPGLMQTPEAILAVACLRRLNDPSDTIATAEILSLAGCEEPESWAADRLRLMAAAPEHAPSGYGNDWKEAGSNAFPLLSELAALRQEMPILSPLEAMQTVVSHGHLSAIVMRWCRNEQEARTKLANLEALLAMARKYEEGSRNASQSASVSGLILWLRDQATDEQDFLATPAIDAVKVMTHHASKGLEWPVVVLTGLESPVRDRLWSITAVSDSPIEVQNPLKDRFIRFWPWPFGRMEKVSIVDRIVQSDSYRQFREAAAEEEKRLLYVSMTRARDLMIFARSDKVKPESWINVIAADWLSGEEGAERLTLPGGQDIPYQHWILEPPEAHAPARTQEKIHWFDENGTITTKSQSGAARLPVKISPSSAAAQTAQIVETAPIGTRMSIKAGTDMAKLGTAIHGCIGASLTDPTSPMTETEIQRALAGMDVEEAVKAGELLGQISAFVEWYKARWPDAIPYAEIPIEMEMQSGQILQGRIDLLLKVSGGWILVDHKSNPGGSDRWAALAQEYAGQMESYKNAVEQVSGERVLESWLFLPIAAGAVRIH